MSYRPDEQDELIGEAEAIGGRAFVERVQYRATAETDAARRWDGSGKNRTSAASRGLRPRAGWLMTAASGWVVTPPPVLAPAGEDLNPYLTSVPSQLGITGVKLMRPTHKAMAAVVSLLGCVALLAVIGQRMSEERSVSPPTGEHGTVIPLPVERGVVPLEPDAVVALTPPKVHRDGHRARRIGLSRRRRHRAATPVQARL